MLHGQCNFESVLVYIPKVIRTWKSRSEKQISNRIQYSKLSCLFNIIMFITYYNYCIFNSITILFLLLCVITLCRVLTIIYLK
jgi:hypothetical protein